MFGTASSTTPPPHSLPRGQRRVQRSAETRTEKLLRSWNELPMQLLYPCLEAHRGCRACRYWTPSDEQCRSSSSELRASGARSERTLLSSARPRPPLPTLLQP